MTVTDAVMGLAKVQWCRRQFVESDGKCKDLAYEPKEWCDACRARHLSIEVESLREQLRAFTDATRGER